MGGWFFWGLSEAGDNVILGRTRRSQFVMVWVTSRRPALSLLAALRFDTLTSVSPGSAVLGVGR